MCSHHFGQPSKLYLKSIIVRYRQIIEVAENYNIKLYEMVGQVDKFPLERNNNARLTNSSFGTQTCIKIFARQKYFRHGVRRGLPFKDWNNESSRKGFVCLHDLILKFVYSGDTLVALSLEHAQ